MQPRNQPSLTLGYTNSHMRAIYKPDCVSSIPDALGIPPRNPTGSTAANDVYCKTVCARPFALGSGTLVFSTAGILVWLTTWVLDQGGGFTQHELVVCIPVFALAIGFWLSKVFNYDRSLCDAIKRLSMRRTFFLYAFAWTPLVWLYMVALRRSLVTMVAIASQLRAIIDWWVIVIHINDSDDDDNSRGGNSSCRESSNSYDASLPTRQQLKGLPLRMLLSIFWDGALVILFADEWMAG